MVYSPPSCPHPAGPAPRLRLLRRSFLPTLLGLWLFIPGMASAQQGKCFQDSNGRQVCCDANGNCK